MRAHIPPLDLFPRALRFPTSGRLEAIAVWSCCVLVVATLLGLLHAGFCAFTWRKFVMFDYGVYTNMIWNSGHGAPFRCLVDRSYLATHLSFTLALLGPLFRLWDHPFLLWTVQWCGLAIGTVLLARTALRLHVPSVQVAALAVFFVGYHYTQRTMLSEFHGVTLYLVLVPWFYYCLRLNRRMVWLPWLLILGMREEAAALVLPMLLYVAVRERWRAGYVYAVLSVGYVVLATTTLFPLCTGMSLLARRHWEIARSPLLSHIGMPSLVLRLKALLWIALPTLPLVRRGTWIPLVTFPLVALLQAMGSGMEFQFSLALHYSAPAMACLGAAMVEALALGASTPATEEPAWRRSPWPVVVALLLTTLASHRALGFLPGGRQRHSAGLGYVRPHGAGLRALQAARHLPRDGVLLCPGQLAGFCANRRDVLDWRHYDPKRISVDHVFTEIKYLDDDRKGYRAWLETGTFGVTYFDGIHVILRRGADTSPNRLVSEAYQRILHGAQFPQTHPPSTPGVSNASVAIPVLHWAGASANESEPIMTAHRNVLGAGDYEAVFLFSAEAPADGGTGSWGSLQVRRVDTPDVLAEGAIEPVGCGSHTLRSQRLAFSLDATNIVVGAVIGRRAELWLQRVDFVRRGEPWGL